MSKNIEIERKYLVKNIPFDINNCKYFDIEQSYISINPIIRLRKKNNEYIFTFKGVGDIERLEFEYNLNKEQYYNLLKKIETKNIIKKRYIINIDNGLNAELDIYSGEFEGFMNVEVEFDSIEQANSFIPPNWFGKEISFDKRYSNAYMSINGLPGKK